MDAEDNDGGRSGEGLRGLRSTWLCLLGGYSSEVGCFTLIVFGVESPLMDAVAGKGKSSFIQSSLAESSLAGLLELRSREQSRRWQVGKAFNTFVVWAAAQKQR